MGWGAALGAIGQAGGNVGGTLYGASQSRRAARVANRRNVYNYQHRHQWEVADLIKSGLNPILSAGGGGSSLAAAPAAAVPDFGKIGDSLGTGAKVAQELRNLKKQGDRIDSESRLASDKALEARSHASNLNTGSEVNRAHALKLKQETKEAAHRTNSVALDNIVRGLQLPGHQIEANIDTGPGAELLRYYNRITSGGGLLPSLLFGVGTRGRGKLKMPTKPQLGMPGAGRRRPQNQRSTHR